MTDLLGLLGAAQGEIVIAVLQQFVGRSGNRANQIGAGAPQPADIVCGQHQIGRPLRLEERLDLAARRVGAALVAVEEVGVAICRCCQRHFEQRVAAELVARRHDGEKSSALGIIGDERLPRQLAHNLDPAGDALERGAQAAVRDRFRLGGDDQPPVPVNLRAERCDCR